MSEYMPRVTTNRRGALLGGAMLLTAATTWARLPRHRIVAVEHRDIDSIVPLRAAGWMAAPNGDIVVPPEDEQKAASVYQDQVMRNYVRNNDSPTIMFLVAYDRNQSGMLMVHRPESCYPGSGFTITDDQPTMIPLTANLTLRGRFLSTQRDARVEQVLYWTRLGNEFPNTWDEERSFLAMQNLHGLAPDGALVRMSMIDPDPQAAKLQLIRFASALYAASGRDGRALLAGPASVSPGTV